LANPYQADNSTLKERLKVMFGGLIKVSKYDKVIAKRRDRHDFHEDRY
jgi:hypothetical protein